MAHEDNAGDTLSEIMSDVVDLVDDFLSSKGSRQAGETSCAESAMHPTSSLGRDADRKSGARGHSDGFDGNAVGELQKVLSRAVF